MTSGGLATLNPDFSQCSICLEDFKQPKFLDCHHTFCMECIRDLDKKSPGTLSCPLCQREIQLPHGGVEQLTSNFYILNINTNKPAECIQTLISEKPSSRNNLYLENGVKAELDGVTFQFILSEISGILCVRIIISEADSPFVQSCNIAYDISLVNQKDPKFSVRQTGNSEITQSWWSDSIGLITKSDAFKICNRFIVKELTGKTDKTFQLDVNMKVTIKIEKNFNVK